MVKLSIIVSSYNTEKYLARCFDSLVSQLEGDIEIIVINDGSTDNGQSIIDNYVCRYPKIFRSYVRNDNGGPGIARNDGLQYVTGEYITFVDSDDWIDADLYATMFQEAINSNCDIVCCNFIEYYTNKTSFVSVKNTQNKYFGNMLVWNKIYKRDFWRKYNFCFIPGILHEDNELIPKVLSVAQNIGYVEGIHYNYERRNSTSITSGNMRHLQFFPEIIESLNQWCIDNCPTDSSLADFISHMAYIYIIEVRDVALAESFFHKWRIYFKYSRFHSLNNWVILFLFSVNFKMAYKLRSIIRIKHPKK